VSLDLRVSCESGGGLCILAAFSLATAKGPNGLSGESIAPSDIDVLGCGEVWLQVEFCSAKSSNDGTITGFVTTFAVGSPRIFCGTVDDEGS
jgi:hypothetical protein